METARQLPLQPRGELHPDRLDKDNSLGRDHKHRHIIVHAGVVSVAGEFADFLAFDIRLLIEGPLLREQAHRQATPQRDQKEYLFHGVSPVMSKPLPSVAAL